MFFLNFIYTFVCFKLSINIDSALNFSEKTQKDQNQKCDP